MGSLIIYFGFITKIWEKRNIWTYVIATTVHNLFFLLYTDPISSLYEYFILNTCSSYLAISSIPFQSVFWKKTTKMWRFPTDII